VMEATASIRMTTSTNFEIKRTVDLVFFRSVNASQVFCHFDELWFDIRACGLSIGSKLAYVRLASFWFGAVCGVRSNNRLSVDLLVLLIDSFYYFVAGGDTTSMLRSDLLCYSNCELIVVNCLVLLAAGHAVVANKSILETGLLVRS